MDELDRCPSCGANWRGKPIPDGLFDTGAYATRKDAEDDAASYGWTPGSNKCFKLEVAIYDVWRDCTVAYECPCCKVQVPCDHK